VALYKVKVPSGPLVGSLYEQAVAEAGVHTELFGGGSQRRVIRTGCQIRDIDRVPFTQRVRRRAKTVLVLQPVQVGGERIAGEKVDNALVTPESDAGPLTAVHRLGGEFEDAWQHLIDAI
jgi:hypothetical protein